MTLDGGTAFATILSIAFALWAGVVAWIGHGIRSDFQAVRRELSDIRKDFKTEGTRLNSYILQTETRLTRLEDKVLQR